MTVHDFGLAGEDIVCFGGEDWFYHHPHSKNHLLSRFARQNRVLFINSIGMGLPKASNPDFFLKIRRKLSSYAQWIRRPQRGLWVMTPVALPFYGSSVVRWLNRFLLWAQVRMTMMFTGMRSNPIVWACTPFAADAVRMLQPKLVLYQVSDKYEANEDATTERELIVAYHEDLKAQAAVVLYSGRKLYDEATEPHRYFMEQAVDFEHFSRPGDETAADIASIPRPTLGYMGWIDYIMDVSLIRQVAERRPSWHWVFIGRKSNLVNIDVPNVHFLGPKPYSDLPQYLRHIDLCVLPWQQQHEFTSYGSAIKVREYLASGKPVIISPLYEYLSFPGIRIYHTAEEFIALAEEALLSDSQGQQLRRQESVRHCTWDARAREVGDVISSLLRSDKRLRTVDVQSASSQVI